MKWIDLSHLIVDKMPTYPSDPDVSIIKEKNINNNGTLLHSFQMGTHTGTHLDAPAHVIPNSNTLNNFSLDSFSGLAIRIKLNQFDFLDKINYKIDGIIYDTGWYKKFKSPEIFFGKKRPIISKNFIDKCLARNIKFFGCDLPSVDKSGSVDKPVHNSLLKKNIILYECLTNLNKLPLSKPFEFYGFPLPLNNLDGSPVRAVAKI